MHWIHLSPFDFRSLDWLLATWYACIFKHILLCEEHFSGHGLWCSGSALGCVVRLHLRDGFQGKMMTSFCHSFKRACLFWIASNSDQLKCWNVPKRCSLRASTHKGWRLHHNYSVWRNVYGCVGWHVDSVLVIFQQWPTAMIKQIRQNVLAFLFVMKWIRWDAGFVFYFEAACGYDLSVFMVALWFPLASSPWTFIVPVVYAIVFAFCYEWIMTIWGGLLPFDSHPPSSVLESHGSCLQAPVIYLCHYWVFVQLWLLS